MVIRNTRLAESIQIPVLLILLLRKKRQNCSFYQLYFEKNIQ